MLNVLNSFIVRFRKYLSYVRIDLKEAYYYRFNMIIWILVDIIVPFIMIFVWIGVFKETKEVHNYDVNKMVTYYVVANFCLMATTPNLEWFLTNHIKNGGLSSSLLKPIDFFWRCIWGETSGQIIRMTIYFPFFLMMFVIYHNYITYSEMSFMRIFLFLLSVNISYFVNCSLKMMLGTLAFWLVDCWGIFATYRVLTQILSGALIPIILLPSTIADIANVLPFKMLISFPVSFILGEISINEYITILLVEVFWLVGLLLSARAFWAKGLQRYEAVGG